MKHDEFTVIDRANMFLPDADTYGNDICAIQIDLPHDDKATYYSVFYKKIVAGKQKRWELISFREGKIEQG
jgi:hypothetical protein